MARSSKGRVLAALGLSGGIAGAGYLRGALSRSGAVGALLVGTATYLAGGPRWSALLLGFFGSSSALSRLEERSAGGKAIAAIAERGSRRDLVQALANGGVATLAALGELRLSHPAWGAAYAGALAAANADTWATEIGGLSASAPRHIVSNAPVEPGTSGGVTVVGLGGAAAGSALIGVLAALVQAGDAAASMGVSVTLAGIAGSLVDSLAGATIQAGYRCPACGKPTERRVHRCGTRTVLVRGWPWVTNDVVNATCTAVGALLAGGAVALAARTEARR